ncbi:hypothetical protein L596_008997 [Steinernema carpocapsae]|uniref:Uncharacterized protein n=1 Tax=Steinernema carpocapsae TaxID=34508 RepID=A0A4V6A6H3_STECR|nr:hypothetical protein L596_008997 [Steinernema carpocapsae]
MTKESERVLKIKSEVLMFDMEYMPDRSGFFYVMHYISEQYNVTLSQLMFTYVTAASMSTVYRAPEECQIEKLP